MKYLYAIGGATTPLIKEYEIDPEMVVEKGDVVYQSASGVIKNAVIGAALGLAQETHTGTEDPLNPRNNGNKLMINVTFGGVYETDAPHAKATQNGTATTFICGSSYASQNLSNARLVFVKKGENSKNTDDIGTVRVVERVNIENSVATFTIAEGGVTYEGDEYAVLPDYGFIGSLDNDCKSFSVNGGGSARLTVVDFDTERCTLEVTLKNGFFNL